MTRVPVILHGRLGDWFRQLRPRMHDQPIRWFESRSPEDLGVLLIGLAFPVVLIDLGRQPESALRDLGLISLNAPSARALVLDSKAVEGFAVLARDLAQPTCSRDSCPHRLLPKFFLVGS